MKFLPTDSQLTAALQQQSRELCTIEAVGSLETLHDAKAVQALYNQTVKLIEQYGADASRQWRAAIVMSIRLGWCMRENVEDVSAIEKALGVTDAEMEEFRKGMASETPHRSTGTV